MRSDRDLWKYIISTLVVLTIMISLIKALPIRLTSWT